MQTRERVKLWPVLSAASGELHQRRASLYHPAMLVSVAIVRGEACRSMLGACSQDTG